MISPQYVLEHLFQKVKYEQLLISAYFSFRQSHFVKVCQYMVSSELYPHFEENQSMLG